MKTGKVWAGILAVCCLLTAPLAMADEEIVIGHPACLSGSFAKSGEQAVGGIKACVFWVNNNYGGVTIDGKKVPLVYKYYDCESSQDSVATLIAQLISTDKANAIVAPYSSDLTMYGAPIAESQKKIYLNHGGANNELFGQGYRYMVQTIGPATHYHKSTLDMIKKMIPQAKRVALAYEDTEFARMVMQGAEEHAKALGFKVVFKRTYPKDISDFTSILSALKWIRPDVVLGGGGVESGLLFNRQMGELEVNVNALSLINAVAQPGYYAALTTMAEGVMGPSQWESGATYSSADAEKAGMRWIGPSQDEFVKLFQMAMAKEVLPDYRAAQAGAQVLAYVLAVEDAKSLDSDKVRESLGKLSFMSFYGGWDVDATGLQVGHTMVNVQWQNGQRIITWPEEAQDGLLYYPMPTFAERAAGKKAVYE